MNKNTNTQTDTETIQMSLQSAHFFPHFFKVGKYLLPLLAGLFILAACGGGGAAPTTVEEDPTTDICETNLFDDACKAPDVATKRAAKITECITGGAAGDFTCKQARDANPCLTDPLAPTCTVETVGADFVAHLETAKVERANFCRQGNNISEETELCGSAVTTLCSANPFDAICGANVAARQTFCRSAITDDRCTTTISTFCATITAGNFADVLCGTSASAAVRGAYCVGLQAGDRPEACGNDTEEDSLIRAYCTSGSAEALLDTNNNCATSLAKVCETLPFGHACTSDANILARAVMCRNNQQGDNSCDTTITAICEGGGVAIAATPLDSLCADGTYDADRQTACDGQNVTTPNEDCLPVIRSLCTAEPFNPSAGEGTTKFNCLGSATYDPARMARNIDCRGDPSDDEKCMRAVIASCGTTIAPKLSTIFDDLCNVGYDDARTTACANAPATTVRALPSTKCGSETTAGYLFDYCKEEAGAANDTHCPERYEASGVRADRWQTDAVDANENPLNLIPAGGEDKDDALTNFIVGGKEGLGFVADGTIITQILRDNSDNNGRNDIRLNAVTNNNEDEKSGFGYTRILRGDVASTTFRNKTYVGLLSGTDVGAPIHDNTKTGVWIARLTFLLDSTAFSSPSAFILDVSFGPNTIKTRANSRPWVNSDGSRTLGIDGKFTNAGVLYGTTDFYVGVGSIASAGRGTLSGVIGANGAVGVFASDTLASNAYAGGFVATLGGCTAYPFNAACTSDVDIRARAIACLGDIDTNGTGGCDATARAICVDGTTGSGGAIAANILDPLCSRIPEFFDSIVTTCIGAPNNQGDFSDCPARLNLFCPSSGRRHHLCPAQVVRTGVTDFIRWRETAVDANNENKLVILQEIEGVTDPESVNFVEAGDNGLKDGAYYENGHIIGGRNPSPTNNDFGSLTGRVLRLSDLAGARTATRSGIAATAGFIFKGGSVTENFNRFYAGILAGTDVGAPFTNENQPLALWDAKLTLVRIGSARVYDLILAVNFDPNTIEFRDSVPLILDTEGNSFSIDGKFTAAGIIYGTTKFTAPQKGSRPDNILAGTLTGLIGQKGAVAVFGRNPGAGFTYTGGFVATPITCELYPFADICNDDAHIREQLRLCRGNLRVNGEDGCKATLNIICRVGTINNGNGGAIAGDLFADPLCTSSTFFNDELVNACKEDKTNEGKFLACPNLLSNLCPNSGNRNVNCPPRPVLANVVNFSRWTEEAVAANGNDELTILGEIGLDDTLVNYVEAGAARVNRIFNLSSSYPISARLDGSDIGYSIERATLNFRNGFTPAFNGEITTDWISIDGIGRSKYYAGIFDTTDVGAPLTAENSTEAIWTAQFRLISGYKRNQLYYETGPSFSLEVNFDPNTIKTRDTDAVKFGFIQRGNYITTGGIAGHIIIDGKFTAEGVIYGKSSLVLTGAGVDDGESAAAGEGRVVSDGSLTGLIGTGGAVGVFISDGNVKDAGAYVGGFVARNPNLCLDEPFVNHCPQTPRFWLIRAKMCEGNIDVNGVDGCDATITAVCSITENSDSAINPFHAICGDDGTYDESRSLSCVDNKDGYIDDEDDNCALRVTKVCEAANDNNPLDAICTDGKYTERRQALCAGDSVDNPLITGCASVIADFCIDNPFNNAQSAGTVKFDCNGSVAYEIERLKDCVVDITDLGVFTACPTIVASFCPISGPRHSECSEQVTTPGVTDFIRWKKDAVATDGTTPLTILEEVGANDADVNYVQAGETSINAGFLLKEDGSFKDLVGRTGDSFALDLSDVGLLDDTASGVQPARYVHPDSGTPGSEGFSTTGAKYYVGIFSGTDLGAPLTASNNAEAIWTAKLIMLGNGSSNYSDDFTLEVTFGPNKIKTRDLDHVLIAFGSTITGRVILDGTFTEDGVIYGTSQVKLTDTNHPTRPGEELTSDGSLTGLIGEKGAVGAFISDGDLNDAGVYAGGFVARNPNRCVLNPFSGYCDDEASILAREKKCEKNINVNGVDGCDATIEEICGDADNDGTAPNPFNQRLCYVDDTYAESRRMSCVRDKNAFIGCGGVITKICIVDGDLLNDVCAGTHDSRREFRCAGQVVDAETEEGCVPVITRLCNSDPFNAKAGLGLTKFDCAGSGTYDMVRQDRMTLCLSSQTNNDPLCTQSGTLAIIALCADDPFDTQCDIYVEQYRQARMTRDLLCRGDATMRGNTACTNAGLRICDAGDEPFAPVCGANDGINNAEQRVAFCNNNVADPRCTPTITTFCSTALGANLFMDICYTEDTADAFIDNRVAACQIPRANTEVHADCETLVDTRCPDTGLRSPACVREGTLPTSVWVYKAQNADGGRLEILDKVGLNDAYTNYIQGTTAGLNTDVLYDAGTLKAGALIRSGVLSITDLDNVDDNATGGVAAARITLPEFTTPNKAKYYAGLLDNVDLGGPLVDNSADGLWNARFYAIYGVSGGVQTDLETSMIVNFDAKSIKTRDIDDALGLADPVALSNDGGNITINAKFTTAGVIYGTSGWSDGRLDGNSSTGTVTGLIGKYGAIGAFVGSGENIGGNTQGEYAGGFVAAPVNCTANGKPFSRLCDGMDEPVMMAQKAVCDADLARAFDPLCAPYATTPQKTMFAEICRLDADAKGCEFPINGISGLTVAECADNDTGNPYQTGCGDGDFDAIFAAERMARDLSCTGSDVYDASQCSEVLGNCFGSVSDTGCDALVKLVCDVSVGRDGRCDNTVLMVCTDQFNTPADPLNIICENDYVQERQTECMGQNVAMLSEGDRCLPVISALCNNDPFNGAVAGLGGTTFDCTAGDTYSGARQSACAGQDVTMLSDGDRCKPVINTLCESDPFNTAAGVGATTFDCTVGDTYDMARETACRANINADGNSCWDVLTTPGTFPGQNTCRSNQAQLACDEVRRENACLTYPVRNDLTCAKIIAERCRLDPLNTSAGVGIVKYDCANYRVLPNYDPNNVTPFTKTAQDKLVADIAAEFKALREARVALCKNPANSEDPLCLVPTTLAFITTCASNPFDATCELFGDQYGTERDNRIANCLMDASPFECSHQGVRAELLTSCNGIVDNRESAAPGCDIVAADFCPTAFGADVFNSACDADYTIQQVAACAADMGVDGGCDDLITKNCPADSTKPECAREITAAVWEDYAVSFDNPVSIARSGNLGLLANALNNSNNLSRLTVLDEAGADDPVFNYVKAGADGLNLDFLKDEDGNFKTAPIPAVEAVTRTVMVRGEDGMLKIATITDTAAASARFGRGQYSQDENQFRDETRTTAVADERVLKSYDGGTYEDTAKTSGVAFASINYGGFAYDSVHGYQRYYAGILSGTDLGGPVTRTTLGFAEWKGKLGVMFTGRYYTKDFILTVDVGGKQFSGQDRNESPRHGIIEILNLNGKFNDAGVMYGTSHMQRLYDPLVTLYQNCVASHDGTNKSLPAPTLVCTPDLDPKKGNVLLGSGGNVTFTASYGSLTGLIGRQGAVGVFVSDGAGNTAGSYVGGFVVDNPDVSPDCSSETGTPFDFIRCRDSDRERAELCIKRGTNGENLPSGVSASDCNTPELLSFICRGDFAPFDTLCADDRYDYNRQLACGSQDVNNPDQSLCVDVIAKLCEAEPFNPSAGPGVNKFDCLSANSDAVVQARKTRIALCLDEATDDDPLCKQGDFVAALATCVDNPLADACTQDGVRVVLLACIRNPKDPVCTQAGVPAVLASCTASLLDTAESITESCTQGVSAIVSACVADRERDDPLSAICAPRGVPAVLATCAADPFDAVCTGDIAEHYMQARETRLETCRMDETARGDAICDNALPTICASGDTPFSDLCVNNDTARIAAVESCLVPATEDADVCDTVVSGARSVKYCIANPYKARCSQPAFYAARAKICESEATSFTAGCLSDSDFATNYRPVEIEKQETREAFLARCKDPAMDKTACHTIVARTAREALIVRCADSNPDNDAGCNTDIGNGTMLSACITNPFLTDCVGTDSTLAALTDCLEDKSNDCSAEVVAFATASAVASALMTHRDAFVARCADPNTDKMGCEGAVGGSTIASCITTPSGTDCAASGAFASYVEVDCKMTANLFAPRCQGGIDEAVIIARAELALGCDILDTGTGCDTIIVSGSLTVNMCNDTPFATGCEDAAFANIRRVKCKEGSGDATCSVAEGQGVTNYVQGGASELELGDSIYKHDNPDTDDIHEGVVYVEDDPKTRTIDESVAVDIDGNPIADVEGTPLDESRVVVVLPDDNMETTDINENRYLREGIVTGGLTLNDLVEATDNDKHGFAFAYIPEGRGGINGTDRFYAGLLSGTDESGSLGGEITADAMWHGKVSIVSGLGGEVLTEQADFALTIDFANKTLKSGDIAVPKLGGLFAIDGKFSGKVIYGATSLREVPSTLGEIPDGLYSRGSLIGLIGENGAVGAFVSSGAGVLVNTFGEYAGGFVASEDARNLIPVVDACDPGDNVLNPTCANTPEDVDLCAVYDLDTLKAVGTPTAPQTMCISVLGRLDAREKACEDENDLNALTNPLCEAVIARACDGNIFKTDAGTGAAFDCTTITEYAATRQQICRNPVYANGGAIVSLGDVDSVTAEITACGQIITDICTGDPFAKTIGRNPTHLCDSPTRKTACMGMVPRDSVAPQKCFDTIQEVCNANPFDENFCYSSNFDYTSTQLRLCNTDMNAGGAGVCATIIQANCPVEGVRNAECHSSRLTAWVDSLEPKPELSIPDPETQTARILLGRANGLDTKTNVTSILAPEFVLRLKEGYSIGQKGNIIRAKGYESGIAVFSANTTNGTIGHYAGILAGTDVGAPLTDPEVDAIWSGDIAWVSSSDGVAFVKRAYNFTLNVNYDTSTISGSGIRGSGITDITDALAHVPGRLNNDVLSDLTARWDSDTGIFTGTINLKVNDTTSSGVLTGMIGNNGAVGVFTSDDEQPVAFAGGFVASPTNTPRVSPPVGADTWVARATVDVLDADDVEFTGPTRYHSDFIRGGKDGLGLAPEFVLRLDEVLDDDMSDIDRYNENLARYNSGFALFFGDPGTTRLDRYYAGLLSGTTVGQNLPNGEMFNGEVSATWGGRISAFFGNHSTPALTSGVSGITEEAVGPHFISVTDTNFQLLINFVDGTVKTPDGKGSFNLANLRFDGAFNHRGILSGTVKSGAVDSNQETNTYGPGTFTGIIGQEAAIGVFKADRGQASNDIKNRGYIGGFIATACDFDNFALGCAEDKRTAAGITAACINPLHNAGINPFKEECSREANQTAVETAKRDACLAHNPFPNPECQTLTSVEDACKGDSFRQVGCAARNDYEAIKSVFCFNNPNAQSCPDVDATKVTAGDWKRGQSAPLNTNPATTTPTNEFLQIAENTKTISTMGTTKAATGNEAPELFTLNFSELLSYDDVSFSVDNGLAYFSGYQGNTLYHYAGIFGTTDLGAPIDTDITTTWDGMLSINGTSKDFTLTVVFNGSANTVDGFVVDAMGAKDFLIDGDFTDNGVITGTTNFAEYTGDVVGGQIIGTAQSGILSGLIGTDGVVAAFIGGGYAGGFIATPENTTNFADLLGSFTGGDELDVNPNITTQENQFLQIAEKTISITGTTKAADGLGGDPDVTTLDFSEISYAGSLSADDGLAYFSGYQGNTLYHYAGIFGSTDLGAPIAESGFSATWIGLVKINASTDEMYFTLTVASSTGTGGTIDGFIANVSGTSDLLIAGTFAVNGVLTGKVHYAEFANEAAPATPAPFNGSLSGLIGTDGAVATFIGTGYAGGFVAVPLVGICKVNVFDMRCPVREQTPARVAFCTNITDNGGANPFNVDCMEGTHGEVDVAKRDSCLSHITFPDVMCNGLDSVRMACEVDFLTNVGCATRSDFAAIKDVFCAKGTDASIAFAGCPNVTSGDWVASFTDPSTAPDTDTPTNEFLQIEGKTISTARTTAGENGAGGDPTPTVLDFSVLVSYPDVSFSIDDGLAYFSGYQGADLYHYAGIYGTSDLGLPIAESDFSAIWPAMLSIRDAEQNFTEQEFSLKVTFVGETGTIKVDANEEFISISFRPNLRINGTFGASGVITGSVYYAFDAQTVTNVRNGSLSGLIGTDGVVAAFISDATGAAGYVGGFVAAPSDTARSADLLGSFTGGEELDVNPNPATLTNEFLQIEGNAISIAGTTVEENGLGGDPTPTTLDFSEISYGGVTLSADNGFAYFNGYQADILYHYAGIFATSDLGAPITLTTNPSADWDGILKLGDTDATFALTVVFDGSDNTVKGFMANISGASDFLIDGTFNVNGVITGKVHYAEFTDDTTPETTLERNGTLSGLIGVDGAVAVFISDDTGAVGYAGGFIATPSVAICPTNIFDAACFFRENIPAITAFCTNIIDNAGTNPFNTGCRETTHGNVATAQKNSCFANATFPHVRCQTLGLVKMACVRDPFTDAVCATRNDYDTILAAYCARPENFDNTAVCPNANSGRWVASRTGLNTDPDTTDAKNEFLQIAEKTISTTGTTREANVDGVAPDLRTLNLSELHASFSADDGLAYFSGYQGDDLHHYAGIFGSTDLGAPIAINTNPDAMWDGMLSINGVSKGFTLTVVFNGSANTVDGFVIDAMGAKDLLIDGDFTANGVITGTTNFAEYTGDDVDGQIIGVAQSGILSGLIGMDGAVAVFTSTATGDAGYAGGFVAAPEPQVNFADWTGSFAGGFNNTQILLDTGADVTEFVAGTTSFIPLNANNQIVLSNQTITDPTILRLSDTNTEDAYKSGVAFWHGNVGTIPQYYAGLLPTTDLGAPLTDVDKNGTWIGKISGITNGDTFNDAEIKFLVTFDDTLINHVGRISSIRNKTDYTYAAGATGIGTVRLPVIDSVDNNSYSNQFNFDGIFNAQGVIRGFVGHSNASPRAVGISFGVFNGLIGVDGAVGVFKSNDSGQPYSFIGGFVANPPAE
ncbi:MAG: hypothetical protein ACNYPD_04355 [Candidatus Halichondribacter symbioticus]